MFNNYNIESSTSEINQNSAELQENADEQSSTIQKENSDIHKEETKEVVKEEEPQIFDPLSDPRIKKTKVPVRTIPSHKEEGSFVTKRIINNEQLIESEDHINHSSGQMSKSYKSYSRDDVSYEDMIYHKADEIDNSAEHHEIYTENGNTSQKVMNYLSGSINILNEKRKQYVDPLVQKGITEVGKFTHYDKKNGKDLQQQKILYEKLKKVKKFLENFKGEREYDSGGQSHIKVKVNEDKLQYIHREIDTMIEMTYTKPNFE